VCQVFPTAGNFGSLQEIQAYIHKNGGYWHNQNIRIDFQVLEDVWSKTLAILEREELPPPWNITMNYNY
jgi:hypothetical protein